jgi:hypothetical protein
MENLSFQTPALASVGVLGCEVGVANAGQVEVRVCESVNHAATVIDQANAALIQNPRVQLIAPLYAGWGFDGVADLLGALQLHRVCPAVALIHHVPQAVKSSLITGRRDVQAPA